MKNATKLAIAAALIIAGNSAQAAGLTKVDDGISATTYIYKDSIQKAGKFSSAWEVISYKKARYTKDGKEMLSYKAKTQYDCQEGKSRPQSITTYSDVMGKGQVVSSSSYDDTESWNYLVPESVGEAILKMVCK